ncbi:MAG: response regulator [bacterium]
MSTTILVADDEQAIRLLIQRMLQEDGYTIVTASDGLEAQEIILQQQYNFSVVVSDWSMPNMTGIELIRWMKKDRRLARIPVVLQTVYNQPENIREGIEAGAFYYLIKPIQTDLLRSIVKAAVTDFEYKEKMVNKLDQAEHAFTLVHEGTFRFRTIKEAESLAIQIARTTINPEDTMAIIELFINAVEHGNLGLTYQEKSELVEHDNWSKELERRLELPEQANKFVEVRISKNDEGTSVLVIDQGKGFDYQRFMKIDEARLFDNHGRGIAIAKSLLNVRYIGSGNHVQVLIPHNQEVQ